MHDVMRAVKRARLDGTHYVMHKYLINKIFNNNLLCNIIVLVWHSNLTKENWLCWLVLTRFIDNSEAAYRTFLGHSVYSC